MAQQAPADVLRRYLSDAIAAEKNFEDQLRAFAKECDFTAAKAVFAQHADETARQHQLLTDRLNALGGAPSGMKSFLSHLLGFSPKMAQLGHDDAEKSTQDLMMAYAVENSEIAMYEALATSAMAAGDTQTEQLARQIQQEEKAAAQKVWDLIVPSARWAFEKVTGQTMARAA